MQLPETQKTTRQKDRDIHQAYLQQILNKGMCLRHI